MKWVRLTCAQEAVVPVDEPDGLTEAQYREAALRVLDASGGAQWRDTAGEVEVHDEPIGYSDDEPPIAWPPAGARRFDRDGVSFDAGAAERAISAYYQRGRRR